jgi:protein tyrosine phosphatase (PTP) superfamily phosphohydrolase (DUF442 family)
MNTIYNFREVSDRLSCAGQPRETQLALIAADGFNVIINLGLTGARYSLADEASAVKAFGLAYYHIPVLFDSPQSDDLVAFIRLMDIHLNEKILVHCAANYRASAFTGLYLFAKGKLDADGLFTFINETWQPDAIWTMFIEESIKLLHK